VKANLKVHKQLNLQEKDSKRMKRQLSPLSSRNYKHNEETRNFPSTSDTHKNRKGDSVVRFFFYIYIILRFGESKFEDAQTTCRKKILNE
jgi:hypothetical protein